MRRSCVFYILILLTACSDQPEPKQEAEQKSIIRNLPTEDRAFLLEPLEGALDDVKNMIEKDPSLFSSSKTIDTNGCSGKMTFKLNGADTMMIDLRLTRSFKKERHLRFWDQNGHLFYIESELTYIDENGDASDRRAYRVYLEEDNVLISTYGKSAFGSGEWPDAWQTICPTPAETDYLLRATAGW